MCVFFLISFSCGCCCRLSRIIIIILLLFFFLLVCALIVCVREMYPLQIHPSVGVETAPRIERCIRASVWQLFCLPSIFVVFFFVFYLSSLFLYLSFAHHSTTVRCGDGDYDAPCLPVYAATACSRACVHYSIFNFILNFFSSCVFNPLLVLPAIPLYSL